MILVSGAAGKTGQSIIRALLARGQHVRAFVHRPEQAVAMQALGVQETIAGDMRDPAAWQRACRDARKLYHICPNVSPHEVEIGRLAIAASQEAGIAHFVYHSVLHPQVEAMPHHWHKMRVEELLFTSGLAVTILQPAPYMQNVLAYWPAMVNEGRYAVPYGPATRLGHVDLRDVGEAAARVLCERGHEGATYELCGEAALTPAAIAHIAGEVLGRTIQPATIPLRAWQATARANGLGAYQIEALSRMFRYYEAYGLVGNSQVLRCLLGRPPITFRRFVSDHA